MPMITRSSRGEWTQVVAEYISFGDVIARNVGTANNTSMVDIQLVKSDLRLSTISRVTQG